VVAGGWLFFQIVFANTQPVDTTSGDRTNHKHGTEIMIHYRSEFKTVMIESNFDFSSYILRASKKLECYASWYKGSQILAQAKMNDADAVSKLEELAKNICPHWTNKAGETYSRIERITTGCF